MSDITDRPVRPKVSPEALERARNELLARRVEPAGDGWPPWVWDQLSPDELGAAWQSLAAWLIAEAEAHVLSDKIPARWWRYPALVRQLAALREWQQVANRREAHPREIVEWDDSFYRMVDSVWPRYAGLAESRDDQRHRDRLQRTDEELASYVAAAVVDRRQSRPSNTQT